MKKTIILLVLPHILTSCSLNNSPENKIPGKVNSIKISRDTTHLLKKIQGLYHPNSGEFINCENGKTYSLKNNNLFDSIYKNILPNAYSDEAVFMDLNSSIDMKDSNKINFGIGSAFKIERKNQKNDCINSDYWGTGTEPFWQLQISEKENLIDFYNPMEQKTTHFLYSKPEIKNGITIYSSSDKENKINIIIKKEKCNGAIDSQYDYSVQITLNDKKYSGCASKS